MDNLILRGSKAGLMKTPRRSAKREPGFAGDPIAAQA